MDPLTLLLVVGSFAASQVARKCADSVVDAAWNELRDSFRKRLGRDPLPVDLETKVGLYSLESGVDEELLATARRVVGSSSCLRRAQLTLPALKGAEILWIDDQPDWCAWERATLTALGARITSVESTRSAMAN